MNIAVFGFGVEGRASYDYWLNLGHKVTIIDQKEHIEDLPEGVTAILGEAAKCNLSEFDFVVRSPQVKPAELASATKIWSATNEFFDKCPAPIIGVTGTKGKGTTSTLLAKILEKSGRTVHLVGNIGRPALSVLPQISFKDIVVFELSSFQLWDLQYSPQTAVVLMIEADHLNVHDGMKDYVNAKKNIGKFQTTQDLLVYHPKNKYSAEIAANSKGHKKRYLTDEGAFVSDGYIVIDGTKVCALDSVRLIGNHNIENVCAAVTTAWHYTNDVAAIKTAIESFTGLAHRLEFVKEVDEVSYYNDSYSSTPAATAAAIHSFSQPLTVLVGGYDKNGDFSLVKQALIEHESAVAVVAYGQNRQKIKNSLAEIDNVDVLLIDSVELIDVVAVAKKIAQPRSVVVLSPGTSSFDMFKNFEQRGNEFKKIVQENI